MIMEQGCTIRLWEDGMWLTRWRRSIIAVSYTHLDVYKRQAYTYHSDLSDYLKTIERYALMNTLPIRVSANKIYTYFPVSYTHLDVYKRQDTTDNPR